ncbi:MAG TPA: DUF2846 domain-containing protein [Syntrophorhabdaceae bacterium]|nr:DUF2846 domain-containing protein [Syntrophorhabdaceae bacterium]
MKKTKSFFLLLVVLSSLAGCATSGPKYSEYKAQIPASNPDLGRIYFYRASALGAAVRPNVVLNNEVVGEAISHGFFYVDRAPGEYVAVTSTEVERKASFTLEKNQTRYIRLSISLGFFVGHVYPELVDESDALPEIADCRFTGQMTSGQNQK